MKLFLIACIGIFLSSLTFAEKADPELIASTLDYPPYEYMEDGEARGIAVDLIREALRRSGVEQVSFQFYPWKRAVLLTQTGKSDMLFNAGKNKARQEWGIYVDSVLIQQSYVLFKRAADDFSVAPDFSDCKDKIIAVRRGYLYGSGPFRQALDSERFNAVSLSDSTAQSVSQLLNKRVDMFVGDLLPVLHYIRAEGLQEQIDIVLYQGEKMEVLSWPTYLMFSKARTTETFVQQVTQAFEAMKADGSFADIVSRYTD